MTFPFANLRVNLQLMAFGLFEATLVDNCLICSVASSLKLKKQGRHIDWRRTRFNEVDLATFSSRLAASSAPLSLTRDLQKFSSSFSFNSTTSFRKLVFLPKLFTPGKIWEKKDKIIVLTRKLG